MHACRSSLVALVLVAVTAGLATAQPVISASSTVAGPGETITVTITGTAGHNFALVGSTVGSGMSYGGVALAVGTDVSIIATGVIGGSGSVALGVTPPFQGSTLDRYYLQAVTSTSASFVPTAASSSLVIRNRDLVPPPPQKGSNTATFGVSATLVAGDNYIYSTPTFVATASTTCLVTSSIQIDPVNAVPIGSDFGFHRNAVSRNGASAEDGVYGQYVMSNGLITRQPANTRSSVIGISAGQSVRFGAYLGAVAGNGIGASANVQTSYLCF